MSAARRTKPVVAIDLTVEGSSDYIAEDQQDMTGNTEFGELKSEARSLDPSISNLASKSMPTS